MFLYSRSRSFYLLRHFVKKTFNELGMTVIALLVFVCELKSD